ncbi:MXAN_6230/SCO0854 family RING domain-containing protein [Streptomyces sp. NPDC006368]|uniref:MXAN_6230/SCO0854 family RING domain-containing protein n=1 Tax=Streptomyces sp. NPDC006368 TaxID=3156760 RepID=UPI0033B58319
MQSSLTPVLLRRLRTVYVDGSGPRPADTATARGLVALEAELLERGFAPTARLRAALGGLGPTGLADAGKELLGLIDAELGADRTHMPLFRGFPASVPDDTFQLFVDRVFTLLLQWPDQPCVLCGRVGAVHPVAPCAHLVCHLCWDGTDYSGCPVCHRRIDPADPFLMPTQPHHARVKDAGGAPDVPSGPLRLLDLGTDRSADAAAALDTLLARRTPLPPQDRDDLDVLLAYAPPELDRLPDDIPVRETKALLLGRLLLDPRTRDTVRPLLETWLTTATDVLRLLAVLSGGEPDLLERCRFRSLPRALRRLLLSVLDGLAAESLVEDVLRHPGLWKRAAETLHPYEEHGRHPKAALAFAVLRATDTSAVSFGEELRRTAAEHPRAVRLDGTRVKGNTWSGRVEEALRAKDGKAALGLLAQRPGELLRRLDHLLRLEGAPEKGLRGDRAPGEVCDDLAATLWRALPGAGPGPLLAALGQLSARHLPGERRVFFPRGRVTHSYAVDDTRAPLPAAVTERVGGLLEGEALRRLSTRSRFRLAVLDAGLSGLMVPSAEGAAAKALVSVPRGSTQPLPEGEVLRLFLHWTEPPATRVDLDLSVALFDADWTYVGLCDYTRLVYGGRAAVHSGDLTSAPAPDGATEYVDLDRAGLARAGVRFAVPIVFSFNDIPFNRLVDVFAGFMAPGSKEARSSRYDPRTVRQRYDLVGDSRIHVPMLVDLERGTFLWTDLHLPPAGGYHSVARHGADLGRIGRDLFQYFAAGRTTLWDLAVWHAAARAEETVVVGDGELRYFSRRLGETTGNYARRIRANRAPDVRRAADDPAALAAKAAAGKHVLLALVDGTVAPEGASGTVYRLLPGPVDGCGLEPASAGDLVTPLG